MLFDNNLQCACSLLHCMEHTISFDPFHLQPCAPQGIHEMEEGAEEGEEEEEHVDDEEVAPDAPSAPPGFPQVGEIEGLGGEKAEESKENERQEDKETHERQDVHVTAAAPPVDPIAAPANLSSTPASSPSDAKNTST